MGKRLKTQRRGAGSPVYIATKHGVAVPKYIDYNYTKEQLLKGEIVELINDPARTGVLAKIRFDNGMEDYMIAAEGIYTGQRVEFGANAALEVGNVKHLRECIEGCPVFNIEMAPGDGGSLVKTSGGYALILTKEKGKALVKMPSGKIVEMNANCRATIGCAGGGGRKDKPFVKAGKKYIAMRARHKKYPTVRGVAMNAVDHPFGGANHHPGKSKSTSRHAPPGRKVGDIASSRTGRRKK